MAVSIICIGFIVNKRKRSLVEKETETVKMQWQGTIHNILSSFVGNQQAKLNALLGYSFSFSCLGSLKSQKWLLSIVRSKIKPYCAKKLTLACDATKTLLQSCQCSTKTIATSYDISIHAVSPLWSLSTSK